MCCGSVLERGSDFWRIRKGFEVLRWRSEASIVPPKSKVMKCSSASCRRDDISGISNILRIRIIIRNLPRHRKDLAIIIKIYSIFIDLLEPRTTKIIE